MKTLLLLFLTSASALVHGQTGSHDTTQIKILPCGCCDPHPNHYHYSYQNYGEKDSTKITVQKNQVQQINTANNKAQKKRKKKR